MTTSMTLSVSARACGTFQRQPRKREGVRKKRLKASQVHRGEPPVKKVPVLVACDRQNNMVSHALDHMWWEDIEACLTGHICADTLVCADALAQHSIIAKHLGFTLKTLMAVARLIEKLAGGWLYQLEL